MRLRRKNVLVGISAGIAAYKIPVLIRLLKKEGAEVRVITTSEAQNFVTPLTLSTLSGNPVLSEFYEKNGSWNNHVELALWSDIFLLAPATLNTLAKMAHGICDNLLLATYFSMKKGKIYFAPAMDLDMYKHDSTTKNIQMLIKTGAVELPAQNGKLASGLSGFGRMMEPSEIIQKIIDHQLDSLPLKGQKCLVSAGPTYEPIDPVRYIGNYSSGKMGVAIANALFNKGASVTLVHGPIDKNLVLSGLELRPIQSAEEMQFAMEAEFDKADIVIMAAAVADYRPKNVGQEKMKKSKTEISLELVKNPDILLNLGKRKKSQILVGFALETQDEFENAKKKMIGKNLDFIVVNNPKNEGAGFEHNTNQVSIIFPNDKIKEVPKSQKSEIAEIIVDEIVALK